MTLNKTSNWLEIVFRLEGSVAKTVMPRILLFTFFAALICLFYFLGKEPEFIFHIGDLTNNVVYNLVLGLLLVFRTNTSYERFWDGRKSLGVIVVNIRNLARFIQLSISEKTPEDRDNKQAVLKLLVAFFVATKLLNLIDKMQWWAIPLVAIVSFILLGIEEVGKELENPFLYGANDLPVDHLCNNIAGDIETVANFSAEPVSQVTDREVAHLT